jgi:hypothetical protein
MLKKEDCHDQLQKTQNAGLAMTESSFLPETNAVRDVELLVMT